MFTLDLARAHIRELTRQADDSRRTYDAQEPSRRRRGTRRR